MKIIEVSNYAGGSDNSKDWIEEWEKCTGRKAEKCSNLHCEETNDLVGAHVEHKIKFDEDITDSELYITPLCHKCNAKSPNKMMEVYAEDLMPLK